MSYARVVRFTDVDPAKIEEIRARAETGPPEGVDSTGFKVVHDTDQGTAVFIGFFESEEKLKAAAKVLEAMDASDTPGTRASADSGEVAVEADA
jgi:hypothetical protein